MTLAFAAVFVALWVLQMVLMYRQAQRYMRSVASLRALGDTATGRHRKWGLRTFASIAVVDGTVVGARVLRGATVFASPKDEPALVGMRVDELRSGHVTGVSPRVAEAARHAAELYRTPRRTAASRTATATR